MRLSHGANAALPSKALEDEKPQGVCRTPAEGPTQKRHFGNGLVVV